MQKELQLMGKFSFCFANISDPHFLSKCFSSKKGLMIRYVKLSHLNKLSWLGAVGWLVEGGWLELPTKWKL